MKLQRLCFYMCLWFCSQGGACSQGGSRPRGVWSRGSAWYWEDLVLGGVVWSWWGWCLLPGDCLLPEGGDPPKEMATAMDGMHPTGNAFLCYWNFLLSHSKASLPILALLPVSLNYEKPRFRLQSQTTLKWKKQYSFTFVSPKADPELCKATQHQLGVVNPFLPKTPYTPTKLKLFPISRNCFFKLIKNLKCSISLCMLVSPLPCALDLVNVHWCTDGLLSIFIFGMWLV